MDNVQGQKSSSVPAKSPTLVSQAGGLSNSANDVATLRASVAAIEDAATAHQFLTAQLEVFANSAEPEDEDLPTLTASITAEIEKISVLVRGNTRVRTTLTRELTFLKGLDPKTKAEFSSGIDALLSLNLALDGALNLYFQDEPGAPAQLAWMHAATATIVQEAVVARALNLEHVADAVKALREFDKALWALMRSVPDADADGGPDRYSAFTQARWVAVGGIAPYFTTALNDAVSSLISQCNADGAGIRTLISILNDPNVPGSGVEQIGDIKFTAIQRLKLHIPTLSAEHVVDLYAALDVAAGPLQGTIRADLAQRLTTLGVAEMNGAHDLDAILGVAGGDGTATDRMTPFLPADMNLEAMDTPADLLAAHVVLGNLGEDAAVKAVLTNRLSALAGADPSDDGAGYIRFVTDFHAAYTALSPAMLVETFTGKLPAGLSLGGIQDIDTGLEGEALQKLVRPILLWRVIELAVGDRGGLLHVVQTYVPVLEALGLSREEALTHLTGILRSRLSNTPAGLAAQFHGLNGDQAEDDKAALRDLFVEALMQQAAAAPPEGASNEATQARIQSFLDASLIISGDEWDRNRILTALMTHIAQVLTPEACVGLYTHLVRADGGMAKTITNALWAPLANRVWEQVINGAAADFAGSVNRLRGQLTALTYGSWDLARAMCVKDIAHFLPADLTTGDIKTIYTSLTEDADKDAVRGALVTQRVTLYNALPAAQTTQLFIECVNQLAADLRALEVVAHAIPDINVASKLPLETVEMTPADVDGIIAALAPLGYPAYASVVPRLIKAIESYLGRGNANVAASLTSLQALGQPEAAAKAIIISKLPFAECLNASDLVSTPALQDSLLATVNSFLSNPDNLNDQALLDLLPRMGALLGDKVAAITFPEDASVKLAFKGNGADISSTLTAVQIRVLDTLGTMKYQDPSYLKTFRNQSLIEFKRVSLTLSKLGRHSGHTVDSFERTDSGIVPTSEVVPGVHNYDAKAVDAFLEMASGLAHIEDAEVQIGLLAELKHLVTKMTKGEARRTLGHYQLTTLMGIMDTSAHAITAAAAAAAAAPNDEQATAIRRDFLETMRLLGSEKTLNEVPKKDRLALRSRHTAIMAMAMAQGGAGEATAVSTSEASGSDAPAPSAAPKPLKGFLNLSSISPADTTRLVSIYRAQFSGAGTASEKFGHIVSLANMLKEAVASKDTNEKCTVVMDLLIPMIDAAFKANDFNTALQLVPFLRPLMRLKVDGGKIADVYGTRIATLLRSCAAQPNAALKAEVVKAATDLALETKDYPSKSWERARRVLTLGLAGPLKLSGSASAVTTCGEQTVMLLAKLAKDKSSVVEEAAKDGLFQLYSSRPATMDGPEGAKMRHMVKIGMKDAGLGDSASSFMPNGAIRVDTDPNIAKRDALEVVRKLIIPQKGDADLARAFGNRLNALSHSSDLRPRAVAMMLDEVTKRVMTGGKGEDKDVDTLLGFVLNIASPSSTGLTYAPRERLMALQTLRVLYPLMDTGVQGEIKDIFKEITKGKVPTNTSDAAQLRAQAAEALAWIGVPAKSITEVPKSDSAAGVDAPSSPTSGSSEVASPASLLKTLHKNIANDVEGVDTLRRIIEAVNTQLNSRKEPDVASISQHLDLLAFWMSRYPELATTKPVSDFLLKLSNSRNSLVRFKVVPLLGQFAALCTDYRRETSLIHDRFPSGNVVVKRLHVLATTGDQSVRDAATATFLKLLAGPAEANDAMRSVLKKQFPGEKAARNEATLAGIRAVVHAFRTDVASTLQDMTVTQKLVAIDEVVLSYHKDHTSEVAVVKALGDFLPTRSSDADGASLAAARALMTLYPFLSDDQKSVVYLRLETSMLTNQAVGAFIRSKGADRVRFIAAEDLRGTSGSTFGGAPLSTRTVSDVVRDPAYLGPPSLSRSASRSSRPELENDGAGVAGAVHPTSSFDGDATPPIEKITKVGTGQSPTKNRGFEAKV